MKGRNPEHLPARILAVVGTRPEAIKMAPVVQALRRRSDEVEVQVTLTGQHSRLVDDLLEVLRLAPDHDLDLMTEGQSLYDVAHGCLDGLREVVRAVRPDEVLVQGDTATVFFAGLVSFFEGCRLGHVEAGLRSGEKWSPFPEEMLRRLTDTLTDDHFAPTRRARENLRREGVPAERIHLTGNTVVDALLTVAEEKHPVENPELRRILEGNERLVLLTAHRRESFGAPIREVFRAVAKLVNRVPDLEVLFPVHPNPEVRDPAREILGERDRIHLTDPLGYGDLVRSLEESVLVLTDSGGIQEEAPTFGTPVLVLREVTERPEGVEAGVARLVGTDPDRLLSEALRILQDSEERRKMVAVENPYGDGRAGERIADIVISQLTGRPRELTDWKSLL